MLTNYHCFVLLLFQDWNFRKFILSFCIFIFFLEILNIFPFSLNCKNSSTILNDPCPNTPSSTSFCTFVLIISICWFSPQEKTQNFSIKVNFLPLKQTVKDNGKENGCVFQEPGFPPSLYQLIADSMCTIHFWLNHNKYKTIWYKPLFIMQYSPINST